MTDAIQLTDLQIAIMRVLWSKGESTAVQIWDALRPERGLAQTTIATMLSRLEKRGVIGHHTRARQFIYYPTVTEPEVRRSMVSELTERLFDGNVAELMAHLLSAREMSAGDLARVREMIATHENTPESSDEQR
jgi:predicted transcriptional regulator